MGSSTTRPRLSNKEISNKIGSIATSIPNAVEKLSSTYQGSVPASDKFISEITGVLKLRLLVRTALVDPALVVRVTISRRCWVTIACAMTHALGDRRTFGKKRNLVVRWCTRAFISCLLTSIYRIQYSTCHMICRGRKAWHSPFAPALSSWIPDPSWRDSNSGHPKSRHT